MRSIAFYLLLVSLFSLAGCNKDDVCIDAICQLPSVTQEGKNTFGCLVDGKPWTANTSDAFLVNIKAISSSLVTVNGVSYLGIGTHRRYKAEGADSDLNLYIANTTDKGEYPLNTDRLGLPISSALSSVATFKVSDDFSYPYTTDSLNTGQVIITGLMLLIKYIPALFILLPEINSMVHWYTLQMVGLISNYRNFLLPRFVFLSQLSQENN